MVAMQALPELPALTVEQAEHWVAAALAEARALRQHDAQLYPSLDAPDAIRTADQLHAAWRQWADASSNLLDRASPLLRAGRHVDGSADLHYLIGRTYAMLKLPPRTMLARVDQLRRGDVHTAAEVRDELRLAPRG